MRNSYLISQIVIKTNSCKYVLLFKCILKDRPSKEPIHSTFGNFEMLLYFWSKAKYNSITVTTKWCYCSWSHTPLFLQQPLVLLELGQLVSWISHDNWYQFLSHFYLVYKYFVELVHRLGSLYRPTMLGMPLPLQIT